MIWTQTLHSPFMPLMYQRMKDLYELYVKEHSNIVKLIIEYFILNYKIQFKEIANEEWDFILLTELFNIHSYILADTQHYRKNVPFGMFATTILTTSDYVRDSYGNYLKNKNIRLVQKKSQIKKTKNFLLH